MQISKLDKIGMSASSLCAVHCAALPLVVTLLPLVGLSFLSSEWVEWTLFGSSALLGTSSLCFGYRKHRNKQAFSVLSAGLALLGIGRILHEGRYHAMGVTALVIGGFTVASSHWLNHRFCASCQSCKNH